ncbi:MAG: TPM domain-containing protein [Oscillospiraceae bacterium]|nr:TPM domain-containing protein [Oscillospiraceae bacterium]
MKRIVSATLIILLLMSFVLPFSVGAEDVDLGIDKAYVMDSSGLLSESERNRLETRCKELSETYKCDLRIVTVPDIQEYGHTVIEYFAYDVYQQYDFGYGEGKDCVLITLSTSDRDYDFRVWGDWALTAFTLYGIDDILDSYILNELGNNNYYAAFSVYLDRSEVYFTMAEKGNPFSKSTNPKTISKTLIITAIIAFIFSLILCEVWRGKMKTAKLAKTAGNYIPQGGFVLTNQSDQFTYRTVTRTRIESDSSSSGGSSSSGASSGGSGGSSGRSGKY